jgi:hypothetical protein
MRDYSSPPEGYLDLRIMDLFQKQMEVTTGLVAHVQSLIESGTIFRTFHNVRGIARELSNFGRVVGYPKPAIDADDSSFDAGADWDRTKH